MIVVRTIRNAVLQNMRWYNIDFSWCVFQQLTHAMSQLCLFLMHIGHNKLSKHARCDVMCEV